MRRDLAEDMQRGPQQLLPAIPPLPASPVSPQPCAYLPHHDLSSPYLWCLFICVADEELLRVGAHLVSQTEAGKRKAQAI